MKFYSEVLNKTFDTVKELEVAEKEEAKRKEAEKAELTKATNEKKELAKKVEEADKVLQDAYNKYELAKEECEKILKEAELEIDELIEPAKQAIRDAQKARYKAILDYNEKYGRYDVKYTGERAYQEMQRALKDFDHIFKYFF